MKNQQFTLVTDAETVLDLPFDDLYDAGCDDGSVTSYDGVAYIHFDREASTLVDAIASALRDVEAGLRVAGSPHRVVRVDLDDRASYDVEELRAIERANADLMANRIATAG